MICVLLCMGGDNMGCRNSIKVCVLRKNPDCFIAGCNCHLSSLCFKRPDAYSGATGLEVEGHGVNIHYYFNKSIK